MKLWKRASGALKDQNSIWIANLTRRTGLRNPDIEAAVIKATSHDESYVDYRNAQRVFAWQQRRGQHHVKGTEEPSLMQELVRMQKLQALLDMLLQMKPQSNRINGTLILEAMDCIVIEIFDIYSRICNGIAGVLMRIYSAGKVEAAMALKVLQKATIQGEELTLYFEFCSDIGVINASQCPKVEQIPEEDIRELEDIINGVSQKSNMDHLVQPEERAMVVRENERKKDSKSCLKTVITDDWEAFDEDLMKVNGESSSFLKGKMPVREDPSALFLIPPLQRKNEDLPDLISFL